MRQGIIAAGIVLTSVAAGWAAEPLTVVSPVEQQPLVAGVKRVVQALELVGAPLSAEQAAALEKAYELADAGEAARAIQAVLDPLCVVGVSINPESRVKVAAGQVPLKLLQQGHRVFLVKVHNEGGVTAPLRVSSPNAEPLVKRSTGSADPKITIKPTDVGDRWLDLSMVDGQPLRPAITTYRCARTIRLG
jgi:hypothetical protein